MSLTVSLLETLLSEIENRPKMFFSEPDFAKLASFLTGYLHAIDQVTIDRANSVSLNHSFSYWLNEGPVKTSLFWTEYILLIKADGDPKLAYSILLAEFRRFLREKVLPFVRTGFWKEYSRDPRDPSIFEAEFNADYQSDKIVTYLQAGTRINAAAYSEQDLLSKERKTISPSKYMYTDGEWIWTSELIYYVRNYRVKLDNELLEKIIRLDYTCSELDQKAKEKVDEVFDWYFTEYLRTTRSLRSSQK